MIDPIISLAFSIHSNKGGYALLLGSGVSRSAQILTGWEIVLDFVTKLAGLQGQDCGGDPAGWFRAAFKEEPEYSKLLAALTASPEERQQLLRGYFEPNEQEREDGLKAPTAAHRAIARIVAAGFIRCIITTNFDRLIERAIEDEGITPIVVSTPDGIEGMLPMVHQKCCVIKVHGDYLDTRIKNAPDELKVYDPRLNTLLDRVFDEFGVIVCGWSAQWDDALCNAFDRCKTRRFGLYWATRGKLLDRADRIVKSRGGSIVPITDANRFFEDLAEKVIALEELDRPHPVSVAAASAQVKRLLTSDSNRIRLHDAIADEKERAYAVLQSVFAQLTGTGTTEKVVAAVGKLIPAIEILRAMCIECAYWGQPTTAGLVASSIERLAVDPSPRGGVTLKTGFRAIPSLVIMQAAGVAAVASENIPNAVRIAYLPTITDIYGKGPMLNKLEWTEPDSFIKQLPGYERRHVPFSDWLFDVTRESLSRYTPTAANFDECFDLFELNTITRNRLSGWLQGPGNCRPGGLVS